ncbi:MAG: hypothetical protein ACK5NT_03485 [Pyrinomonadaceae bacterium]
MEILIFGIILVAVMAYVSTRIKRAASAAYDEEPVEKDDFKIVKAKGFLYPLRDPADFPFEAYSKEYGERSTRNIWRARVRLRITDGFELKKIVSNVGRNEQIESESDIGELPAGQTGRLIQSEKADDGVTYKVLRRIIEANGKTYELRTTFLAHHFDAYENSVRAMMNSFVVK